MKPAPPPAARRVSRAFTLIEIMIVVAIIGLMAAVGLPSILKALQKEGMRKAISDVTEACKKTRAKAIWSGQKAVLEIRPSDNAFSIAGGSPGKGFDAISSYTLPKDVNFVMVDINQMDFLGTEVAYIWFKPDGTSDEAIIGLHDRHDYEKITLDFATGIPQVSEFNR